MFGCLSNFDFVQVRTFRLHCLFFHLQFKVENLCRRCGTTYGLLRNGLAGRRGAICGGNSRSIMGPTGLPIRRFSICAGSSGRPGCAIIAARSSEKGRAVGGGVLRVINLEEVGRAASIFPARGLSAGPLRPATGVLRAAAEAGLLSAALLLLAGDAVLAAAASGWFRTGGAFTGFPEVAARTVGLTAGCGETCALASCSGGMRTACFATGSPLLKAFFGTAVVAMVLYA